MTPAQQYHEKQRRIAMAFARAHKVERLPGLVSSFVRQARHHNHKAIHVARLSRAREQHRASSATA
jgi:hypothetical protein